jgi:hypothetical protein
MRISFLPRPTGVSLIVLAAGLVLCAMPHGWAQAPASAAAPAAPSNGGLFPDSEPVLVEKASLRGLLDILTRGDGEAARPMTWQLLAAMWKAREQGTGPSEFLAAGYRAEKLKGMDAATVQNCLLSAWAGAQTLALFTPENIALMERGASPRATRGPDRGAMVNLDTEKLPVVTVTTKALPRKVPAPAGSSIPEQPPLPVNEAAAPAAPAFVVKTTEIKLHEKTALDAAGIRNMVFCLESVDPRNSVTFTFEDRETHHFGYGSQLDTLNQMSRQMGSDGVNRMTTFSPQPIPDTNIRGVKLVTLPFGAIYLDENIGVGVTFRLVIRVASEALMYDRLPPERRKLYEIRNPAP